LIKIIIPCIFRNRRGEREEKERKIGITQYFTNIEIYYFSYLNNIKTEI
jgi:hypothetical protein